MNKMNMKKQNKTKTEHQRIHLLDIFLSASFSQCGEPFKFTDIIMATLNTHSEFQRSILTTFV